MEVQQVKYLVTILLSSVLVLSACGNNQEAEHKDKKEKTEQKDQKEKQKSDNKKEEASNSKKQDDTANQDTNNTQSESNTQNSSTAQSDDNAQTATNEAASQSNTSQQTPPPTEQQQQANQNTNVPNGDAGFGEYKEDGTYCTVGGCLTPEEQKQQEELNYQEMEKYGYSREEYDKIQEEAAVLQQQRDNGEISNETFTEKYLDLYE